MVDLEHYSIKLTFSLNIPSTLMLLLQGIQASAEMVERGTQLVQLGPHVRRHVRVRVLAPRPALRHRTVLHLEILLVVNHDIEQK